MAEIPTDQDYRVLTVLSSGSYSDYRIHCAFEEPADAERAAAALNGDSLFPDYDVETLPVMSSGRLPRRVTRYRMGVIVTTHVERGLRPVLVDNEVWDWEAPPPIRQVPPPSGDKGALFEGTDKDLVVAAATAYLTEMRTGRG